MRSQEKPPGQESSSDSNLPQSVWSLTVPTVVGEAAGGWDLTPALSRKKEKTLTPE
jgi:hypothetical protein